MVAVPALTAVAMPLALTVATPGALEAQVTCVVRSCEAGRTPVYSPMATNFAVWPRTVIGCVDGTIEMEVMRVVMHRPDKEASRRPTSHGFLTTMDPRVTDRTSPQAI